MNKLNVIVIIALILGTLAVLITQLSAAGEDHVVSSPAPFVRVLSTPRVVQASPSIVRCGGERCSVEHLSFRSDER